MRQKITLTLICYLTYLAYLILKLTLSKWALPPESNLGLLAPHYQAKLVMLPVQQFCT